ncbi:hypothetical protein Dsin_021484 [Dipteronia sinensis]|uniref:Uncharacterized protein n=1 Tax=Dipteronia sinensis TaxID=43782 RepID=A0AAE0DZ54_9ROSI|nr:hypothetical protein Dsin_021484 [Dipteronia sinensis]
MPPRRKREIDVDPSSPVDAAPPSTLLASAVAASLFKHQSRNQRTEERARMREREVLSIEEESKPNFK